MPVRLEVHVDIAAARRELRELADKAPLAMARALNRTIKSVQSQTVKAIAADTRLAQKDVRKGLTVTLATRQTLLAKLGVTSERIVLRAFRAKRAARGVTYDLGRGRRLAVGAFIARMRSGHVGVFRRLARTRLPIVELRGPSLGRVFQAQLTATLTRSARELFDKYLAHEIAFLRRRGRR